MIEIKTTRDYKNLLDGMGGDLSKDNFMSNFLYAFNHIHVGCSCKRKARINAANNRKNESIKNLSDKNKTEISNFYKNEKIVFYNENEIILSLNNE